MAETKWTPGPWVAREQEIGYGVWEIRADDDDLIIARVLADVAHPERTRADALLMAAAPAMVEAIRATLDQLDYLRELWGDEGVSRTLCDQLRAALALAEKGGG